MFCGAVERLIIFFEENHGCGSPIVSRTLIAEETGTVTLFSFDERQGLSKHTTPFDALAFILEGDTGIAISGQTLMFLWTILYI